MAHRASCAAPLAFSLLLFGCSAEQLSAATPQARWLYASALGVGFLVPADWTASPEGDAWVIAGPAGSDGYFTTLTLQATSAADSQLDTLIDAAFDAAPALERPRWLHRAPVVVDTSLGLAYLVSFDYQEIERLRAGVLVPTRAAVLSLAYTAPRHLFAAGLHAYELALASLHIDAQP